MWGIIFIYMMIFYTEDLFYERREYFIRFGGQDNIIWNGMEWIDKGFIGINK